MEQLDLIDKKILFELDKDSRMTFSQLGKKLRISKETAFNRVNRLIEKKMIINFQTVISSYRLGYQIYKIYFRLQNMTREMTNKMQNYLLKHEYIFWFANCQGRWDLIIACWSKDIEGFAKIMEEIINRFSENILEKEISISHRNIQFNRRWFYQDRLEPVITTLGEDEKKIDIDDTDFRILQHIVLNSRMKTTDLSKKLKVSPTVVAYRIKQLEKKGLIVGYKFALNTKMLGYQTCKAFVSLKNVTPELKARFIEMCKKDQNIINIVLLLGSWDLELEIEVENFNHFYQIMEELREKNNDIVKSYDSVLIVSEPKQSFLPKPIIEE